jgi:hypothetical protein
METYLSPEQAKLFKAYQKLSEREQLFLEVLSVNYWSLYQTDFLKIFHKVPVAVRGNVRMQPCRI